MRPSDLRGRYGEVRYAAGDNRRLEFLRTTGLSWICLREGSQKVTEPLEDPARQVGLGVTLLKPSKDFT